MIVYFEFIKTRNKEKKLQQFYQYYNCFLKQRLNTRSQHYINRN